VSDKGQAQAASKNGFGEEEFVVAKVLSVGRP